MPTKVLPTQADFEHFKAEMIASGFKQLSDVEFGRSLTRLGLRNHRARASREAGFAFFTNGLIVIVWTTFLDREKYARDEDAGWIVISQGDTAKYFSHPMPRTKGFIENLLRRAVIAKERILNRPLCPVCCAFMQITQGKALKSRYWSCPRHNKRKSWDYGLSPESIEYLKAERKTRRRYRENLKKSGKTVVPAVIKRMPWQVTKPQNLI